MYLKVEYVDVGDCCRLHYVVQMIMLKENDMAWA